MTSRSDRLRLPIVDLAKMHESMINNAREMRDASTKLVDALIANDAREAERLLLKLEDGVEMLRNPYPSEVDLPF